MIGVAGAELERRTADLQFVLVVSWNLHLQANLQELNLMQPRPKDPTPMLLYLYCRCQRGGRVLTGRSPMSINMTRAFQSK